MVKYLNVNLNGLIKFSKISIHRLLGDLKSELELNISSIIINFVSESDIIDLNKKFLGHNYSTDIITFDYSGDKQNIDGELFISYKEAEHNAQKYGVSPEEEITRLIIHGVLHLVGFNDKVKSDRLLMKRFENKLLKKYKKHLIK